MEVFYYFFLLIVKGWTPRVEVRWTPSPPPISEPPPQRQGPGDFLAKHRKNSDPRYIMAAFQKTSEVQGIHVNVKATAAISQPGLWPRIKAADVEKVWRERETTPSPEACP